MHMSRIASNITDLIGNTPLVDLSSLVGKDGVQLYGKMEGHNPGGSVKDRPAYWMLKEAERRGELKPGMKIIEATSGNTGIALAMVAAAKGYDLILTMPESMSMERRVMLKVRHMTHGTAEEDRVTPQIGKSGISPKLFQLFWQPPHPYFVKI